MINQEKNNFLLLKVIVVIIGLTIIGFLLGYSIGQGQTRREAARNGVGAFVIESPDDSSGVWRWATEKTDNK